MEATNIRKKKKSILFIMDSFPLGGISKSLLSLWNELDDKYEIDFLLLHREGLFLSLIPSRIHILDSPIENSFRNPNPLLFFKAIKDLGFKRGLKWINYSLTCCWGKLTGGLAGQICKMDDWLGKNMNPLPKKYDAAIAYQGGRCIYYLVNKVQADIKIGYVHSDYKANPTDYMLYKTDRLYFPKLDYLVTISEACAQSLKETFQDISYKVKVIENICSPKMINELSMESIKFPNNWPGLKLITMGRLDIEVKGLDFVVRAARILKDRGIEFRWYLLGDGEQRSKLEKLIEESGVEDRVIILGAKVNPYPYLRQCDIYVHPSRVEGKSVALDEVKALALPTIVTNFSTVYDQFIPNKTALIVEMESTKIAEAIEILNSNSNLKGELIENLKNENIGNEKEVQKFINLIC